MFAWILYKISKKTGIDLKFLWIGWFIKLLYCILFVQIFSVYYNPSKNYVLQGDSYKFQEDGKLLYEIAKDDPVLYLKIIAGLAGDEPELLQGDLKNSVVWDAGENGETINDNRLIIKLNSFIHFFSRNNSYIHALVFAAISFLGFILIYQSFKDWIHYQKLFLLALLVMPSIAFWSSGITKEAITFFSLGIICWALKKISHDYNFKYLLVLCAGVLISLFNKPHVGLILLPFILFIFTGKFIQWRLSGIWIYIFSITILAVVFTFTPKKINLCERVSFKQSELDNLARGGIFFINDSAFCSFNYIYLKNFETDTLSKIKVLKSTSGEYKLFGQETFHPFTIEPADREYAVYLITAPSNSYFRATQIAGSRLKLITTIPETLLNTLVRPFPQDAGGFLKNFSFIQNIAILFVLIFGIVKRKKIYAADEKYFIVLLTGFSFCLLVLIGWTTPVFGAIARYKTPAELFIIILFFILYHGKKITPAAKN